jgi:hypothetical protein
MRSEYLARPWISGEGKGGRWSHHSGKRVDLNRRELEVMSRLNRALHPLPSTYTTVSTLAYKSRVGDSLKLTSMIYLCFHASRHD